MTGDEEGEMAGTEGDGHRVEPDPPTTISRRTFVKAGAAVAGAAWVGAFGGSVVRSLTVDGPAGEDTSTKAFVYHVPEGEAPWYADLDGRDVLEAEFPVGESAKVFVGGVKAILLRFEERQLLDRTGTDMGLVAYSSTCTHLGCQVYLAKGRTPAGEFPDGVIYCPCHQGAFDPFRNARVLYGPPPQPLPKVPLRVVDGRVEAV